LFLLKQIIKLEKKKFPALTIIEWAEGGGGWLRETFQ